MSVNNHEQYEHRSGSAMKENIVKSILYACVISCMAGPMSKQLEEVANHRFQLTVGFLWLLFYSGYLYDEICAPSRHRMDKSCVGLDILGWICFMGQAIMISVSGTWSVLSGLLGVMIICWSLVRQIHNENRKHHGCDIDKESLCQWRTNGMLPSRIISNNCKWLAENFAFCAFMVVLLICHNICSGRSPTWLVMIVLSIGLFVFVLKTRILTCSLLERAFLCLGRITCDVLTASWKKVCLSTSNKEKQQ